MGPTVFSLGSFARNATAYWQLTLLASTSVALSVASGWTTWDGMKNFTENPLLSFLITFGVQGVMLIAAWLIGETLIGKGGKLVRGSRCWVARPAVLGLLIGATGALTLGVIFSENLFSFLLGVAVAWQLHVLALIVLIAVAFLLFVFRGGSDRPQHSRVYIDLVAIALKHIPLWIMFLTCLVASVFFSFDSLFDTIFSPEERKRAGHTRVQSEISRLLAGVSSEMQLHRQAAIATLFSSPQWAAYDRGVDRLVSAASETAITLRSQNENARQLGEEKITAQLEALAAAEARLDSIETRIRQEREALSAADRSVEQARALVDSREKELATVRTELLLKTAEAEAEAAGAGITKLAGRGPIYRDLKQDEARLKVSESLMTNLLGDAKSELARRKNEREALFAQTDALEIAAVKHRNEIDSAKRRLAMLGSGSEKLPALLENGSEEIAALNEARAEFVTAPSVEGLRELKRRCDALSATLRSVDGMARSAASACDANALNEVTQAVFEANAARDAFQRECSGESRPDGLQDDELLHFGQKCLQISGIESRVRAAFLDDLRQASLRRDDQAHRFVVTWNAFFDRNPLAFVALFIAVAMDGLIFMSGLFGAGARAMLAANSAESVEQDNRRSEMILDAALFPEARERIRLFLEAIDFSNGCAGIVGHVDLDAAEPPQSGALRAVVNAALAVGMARPDGPEGRFAIHPKLIERLSRRLGDSHEPGVKALTQLLRLTLDRDAREVIRTLLRACQPLPSGHDFTHFVDVGRLPGHAREQLISVLNAGVAGSYVSLDAGVSDRYLLGSEFFDRIACILSEAEREADEQGLIAGKPRYFRSITAENRAGPPHASSGEAIEAGAQSEREEDPHLQGLSGTYPALVSIAPGMSALHGDERYPSGGTNINGVSAAIATDAADDAGESKHDAASKPAEETPPAPADRAEVPPISIRPRRLQEEANRGAPRTLVPFPAELTGRRTAHTERNRAGLGRSQRRETDDGNVVQLPDALLEALSGATEISKDELARLIDPQTSFMFAAAYKAVQTLRQNDPTLDRAISQAERAAWLGIQKITQTSKGGAVSEPGSASDTARKLVTRSFARIFLVWRGLKEVQRWCENLVAEYEMLADAERISQADAQKLRRIVRILYALMEVDRERKFVWEELIWRMNGLCDVLGSEAAIDEIMP